MTEWVVIKDWPNYEVADTGQVRSLTVNIIRKNGSPLQLKGRVLRPGRVNKRGHLSVSLTKDGLHKSFLVHRLVLETFVGPAPDGMECRHLDGNTANNDVRNLSWGTSSQNNHDIVAHGNHYWANRTHCFHGHEYTPENTAIREHGARRCKTCLREKATNAR